jgi:hypothetical protein
MLDYHLQMLQQAGLVEIKDESLTLTDVVGQILPGPFPSPHGPIATNRVKQCSYHNREYCGVSMIRQIADIGIRYCGRQKLT